MCERKLSYRGLDEECVNARPANERAYSAGAGHVAIFANFPKRLRSSGLGLDPQIQSLWAVFKSLAHRSFFFAEIAISDLEKFTDSFRARPAQSRSDRSWNSSSENLKRWDRSVWYLKNERIVDLPFFINHIPARKRLLQENLHLIVVVARTVIMLAPDSEFIMFTTRGCREDGTGKLFIWKTHTVLYAYKW